MQYSILQINQVSKKIRTRLLVDHVSFNVQKGEICGLLGPNGAGKTTLIRMITGLITPTAGEITIAGTNIQKDRQRALLQLGAIVESPIFFPYLTGRGNLRNLARLHPNLKEPKKRIQEVLAIVGLEQRADDKVGTYSLGMKQRLGIAQAILGHPKVVILDEPANGLDPMGMRELRELILQLRGDYGITFLISSHLLDEIQKICSRLVLLKEGQLVWKGKTEELSNKSANLEDAFVELMKQ